MTKLTKNEARAIISRAGINTDLDFHALDRDTVQAIISEADARKYRKPRNANGSRARYFHAYVTRVAFSGKGLRQ